MLTILLTTIIWFVFFFSFSLCAAGVLQRGSSVARKQGSKFSYSAVRRGALLHLSTSSHHLQCRVTCHFFPPPIHELWANVNPPQVASEATSSTQHNKCMRRLKLYRNMSSLCSHILGHWRAPMFLQSFYNSHLESIVVSAKLLQLPFGEHWCFCKSVTALSLLQFCSQLQARSDGHGTCAGFKWRRSSFFAISLQLCFLE